MVRRIKEGRRGGRKEVDMEGQRTKTDELWAATEVIEKPASFAVSVGSVRSHAEFTDARAQVWFGRMEGAPTSGTSLASEFENVDVSRSDVINIREHVDSRQVYPEPTPASPLSREAFVECRPSRPALLHSDDSPSLGSPTPEHSCPPLYGRLRSGSNRSHGSQAARSDSTRSATSSPSKGAVDTSSAHRTRSAVKVHAHTSSVNITATSYATPDDAGAALSASAHQGVGLTGISGSASVDDAISTSASTDGATSVFASVKNDAISTSASLDASDPHRFSQRTCASVYTTASAYSQDTQDWRERAPMSNYRTRDSASTFRTSESASTYRTRESASTFRSYGSMSTFQSCDTMSTYRTRDSTSTYRTRDSASTWDSRYDRRSTRSASRGSERSMRSASRGSATRCTKSERLTRSASRGSQRTPTRGSERTVFAVGIPALLFSPFARPFSPLARLPAVLVLLRHVLLFEAIFEVLQALGSLVETVLASVSVAPFVALPQLDVLPPQLVLSPSQLILFAPLLALLAPHDDVLARLDSVRKLAAVAGLAAGAGRGGAVCGGFRGGGGSSRSAASVFGTSRRAASAFKSSQSVASISTQMVLDAFPEVPSSSDEEDVGLAYDRSSQATLDEGSVEGSGTPVAIDGSAPAAVSSKAPLAASPSTTADASPRTAKTRRAMTVVGAPRTPTQKKRSGFAMAKQVDSVGAYPASDAEGSPEKTPRARPRAWSGKENVGGGVFARGAPGVRGTEDLSAHVPRSRSLKAVVTSSTYRGAGAPLRLAHGPNAEVFGRL
ncbi:hypothetical protein HDZ31DRAFT_74042 [Schizophyllum fasciatum]